MARRRRSPSRAKSGRFTSRKRAPARRYRTKRRGTRAGMVRKSARRAYAPKPKARRRRSNPTMFSPATRYALWAGGGTIAGIYADNYNIPGVTAAAAMVPVQAVTNSTVLGLITIALAQFTLKGQARNTARALGVGMLVPTVGNIARDPAGSFSAKTPAFGGALQVVGQNGGAHPQRRLAAPNYSNAYLRASQGLNVA